MHKSASSPETLNLLAFDEFQVIRVEAEVLYPEMRCSVQNLDFGTVNTQSQVAQEITISNYSLVDAAWTATYENISGEEADPGGTHGRENSIFVVSPSSGYIRGRGLGSAKTEKIIITFSPTERKHYSQSLRFVSRRGRSCELLCQGQGTRQEMHEHNRHLFRI